MLMTRHDPHCSREPMAGLREAIAAGRLAAFAAAFHVRRAEGDIPPL